MRSCPILAARSPAPPFPLVGAAAPQESASAQLLADQSLEARVHSPLPGPLAQHVPDALHLDCVRPVRGDAVGVARHFRTAAYPRRLPQPQQPPAPAPSPLAQRWLARPRPAIPSPAQYRRMPAATVLASVPPRPSPALFCAASGGRASISACQAFNTPEGPPAMGGKVRV